MNSSETTHNPLDGITATLEKALQQAREQAEQTINDAKQQADTIINDAKQEAERIINDAREQAERITDSAQANTRARADMERASLAIQEHAAALHTLALGLTGHDTTPHDNTGDTNGGADGTTRKLAPWEQPQDEPAPKPEETPTIDTTEGNNPEHTSAAQDATTPPTWDAPLIIDAPLQL